MNEISNNYFSLYYFQTLRHFNTNSTKTNIVAALGVLSYCTLIVPLCVGIMTLYGRIGKKNSPSSQNNRVSEVGAKILEQPIVQVDPPAPKSAPKPDSTPSDTETLKLLKKKNRINYRKFQWSAPRYTYPSIGPLAVHRMNEKRISQDRLQSEITRFEQFLQNPTIGSADVVHICIGPGDRIDQVFPRFFFDTFEKNQSIKTLFFEGLYSAFTVPENAYCEEIQKLYSNYTKAASPALSTGVLLDKLESSGHQFHQFLCRYPETGMKTEDTLTEQEATIYPMMGDVYWPNRAQLDKVKKDFSAYIEKELQAGKTVVLGEYRGFLSEDIRLMYNGFFQRFPGQIHLLWRWEGLNVKACGEIQKEDVDPRTPPPTKWTQLKPTGEDCRLPQKHTD